MKEIERKFLVKTLAFKDEAFNSFMIKQGFLNSDKHRTVRIRIKEEQGFITIKGLSSQDGTERFEWEKEIDKEEALKLLELCELPIIEKTRYEVKTGCHIFEVDEFSGDNNGLLIAEIELEKKDDKFAKPAWLGEEVTGEIKYYNSSLIKHPYKKWNR